MRRPPSMFRYGAVVLLFALGLMCKPMLVTLPFVLLLLDYWPLGRVAGGEWRVMGEKKGKSSIPINREQALNNTPNASLVIYRGSRLNSLACRLAASKRSEDGSEVKAA